MITNLSRQWDREVITNVLMLCVVIHNMIIENKMDKDLELTWQE